MIYISACACLHVNPYKYTRTHIHVYTLYICTTICIQVRGVMKEVMQQLAVEQPEDPIKFMVRYMYAHSRMGVALSSEHTWKSSRMNT